MENKLLNTATFTYNHNERTLESVMTHNAFGDILEAIHRLMVCLNYNPTDKFKELLDRDDDIVFSQDFVYELQIFEKGQKLICSTEEINEDIIEGLLRILINEDFNFACHMYGLSPEDTKPYLVKVFEDVVVKAKFNKNKFMKDMRKYWIEDEVQQFQDYLEEHDMSFLDFMEMYNEFKDLDAKAQEKVFELAEEEYKAVEGVSLDLTEHLKVSHLYRW